MSPQDKHVRAAVRRGDVGRLSAELEARDCSAPVLALLVRHDDTRIRHLGWDLVAGRITGRRTEESELAALAGLLPVVPDGPPETALVQARIYQRLWRYVPQRRRPQWRSAQFPARVRIAWLRAEVVNQPSTVRHEPARELLYQAVAGIAAADVADPDELVRELIDGDDPVLHRTALRLTREGLHTGLLAPARARAHVARLLTSPWAGAAALRELAEPWAALDPFPGDRLRAFLTMGTTTGTGTGTGMGTTTGTGTTGTSNGTAAIDAALEVAAQHGHRDLLRDVVADEDLPPRSRQRALEAWGDLAERDDLGELLAIATTDPLLLGAPAVACLRAMHRRGCFPGDEHVAAVMSLALADHTIVADQVATILFTCRRAAFDHLMAAGIDEGNWPQRLTLLVGLAQQGGDDLPIGDAVTGLLATAPRPEPFLAALRALRHTPAEAAILDLLPRAPEAGLHALEAIGGPATAAALAAGLGLPRPDDQGAGQPEVIAPYLRPVRRQALELLWHLTDDPARRRAVLTRLNPRDLPDRIAVDLGAPDPGELALLGADFAPDDPVAALVRLARNGDAGTVGTIADLLLRIVADLATSWEPGGAADLDSSAAPQVAPGWPGERPAGEPAVPGDVVTAVHALGRRLHERGKIRPVCLLDAADADAAGHALVATLACDLLDRSDLSGRERAILLALLRAAPYAGTRARTHRLLRHPDRHVRKNAIALLAADASGADAQVLSASLIALTTAADGQTVRQALLALGHARARWAAPAIAACLDHPTMNVKKTAAAALVRAGTPAAVPKLLFWLGHHDNPGLRDTLVEALRTILGEAYAATVLAAAERAADDRPRRLLLTALHRTLSARAVIALARQQSPVAPTLLALISAGQLRLGHGAVDDLAAQLAAHGILGQSGSAPTVPGPPDPDLEALARDGWSAEVARRVVDVHERRDTPLAPDRVARLRPMLADWLRLADAEPATRPAVLRLVLRICPAPWSAAEVETFTAAVRTLLSGLPEVTGDDRDGLITVLEAVAPGLPAAMAFDVVQQLRALPPAAAGQRSLLALLRRCGAVLTRADVEQSLATARLGANPWLAETAVLREAFVVTTTPGPDQAQAQAQDGIDDDYADQSSGNAGDAVQASRLTLEAAVQAWRLALEAAARTPQDLAEFRSRDDQALPTRDRLAALIEVFPSADRDARGEVLDWLETLQPLDVPRWTLAEEARRPASDPRTPRHGDLDQPRSAALRERLIAMLDAPTAQQRNTAALALQVWPEPRTRQAVLRAFLHGRVDVAPNVHLACALAALDETEVRLATSADAASPGEDADAVRERAARLAVHLAAPDLRRLIPVLLEWWEQGGPATRAAVERALHQVPEHGDAVAEHLRDRLDAGAWGFLRLLAGRPLLRTPALTRTCRRLRADGRDDLADQLLLVDGPLLTPQALDQGAVLAALRSRPQPVPDPTGPPSGPSGPSRRQLLDLIRTGHPEQVRRALTHLAEAAEDTRPADATSVADHDPELADLLAELLHHPEPRVRLHAHRIGRRVLDRRTYLRHTAVLLDDPEPETIRSAVRTLCHAGHRPTIPAIVALLTHPHAGVRRAAAAGLAEVGSPAVPALRHAAGRARPDRRHLYTAVLERIADPGPLTDAAGRSG